MPIAKKAVEPSADTKIAEADAERVQSRPMPAILRSPWPWPRAAMAIILLSLLLWGVVAGIALLAFN